MVKGRNSWTITLRLPEGVREELNKRAEEKGETVSQYLQNCVIRSVHQPVHTMPDTNVSVHQETAKPKIKELQKLIHTMEGKRPVQPTEVQDSSIPFYNSEKHTTGDTVRMVDPKTKAVKTVTL